MRALLPTVFLCFFISFLYVPTSAHAQFAGLDTSANASTLQMSPRHPEPGERVTLTLNDYSINTNGATTAWFVDGVEVASAVNERALTLTVGTLGTQTKVLVVTTLATGTKLEAHMTINPVRVDMLIEADTLTPVFYKGRSIPTSGSPIRVTAIPFTGEARSPEQYSYVWRVGNKVQSGGSRFGHNSITFTSGFEKNISVSVDVIDTDGNIITSESVSVPIANPELHYYEINPLRGMSERAMGNNYIFVGDEILVRAEPYFISSSLLTQNPHREWKLNGRSINNPSDDPQEITLRKEGASGSFSLEFHIRNLQQLLQGVKESITINF